MYNGTDFCLILYNCTSDTLGSNKTTMRINMQFDYRSKIFCLNICS